MILKVKKFYEDAQLPERKHAEDAGADLYAHHVTIDERGNVVCHTGIGVEIPQGYVGLLFPRSSVANKDMVMANSVGVIDAGYNGEILAKFKPTPRAVREPVEHTIYPMTVDPYEKGERCAQLVVIKCELPEFVEVDKLADSSRGENGHGSTGR